MGRTHPEVERSDKVDAIVEVAERAFLADGYAGATMSQLADQAGVAPNAIYWYFASKDHLFVAVGERLLARLVAEAADKHSLPLTEQLAWALERMEMLRGVVSTLHERSERSAVVADFHRRFHQVLRDLLVSALRDEGLDDADLALAADALIAVAESLYAHHEQPARRAQVIDFAIKRLVPGSR